MDCRRQEIIGHCFSLEIDRTWPEIERSGTSSATDEQHGRRVLLSRQTAHVEEQGESRARMVIPVEEVARVEEHSISSLPLLVSPCAILVPFLVHVSPCNLKNPCSSTSIIPLYLHSLVCRRVPRMVVVRLFVLQFRVRYMQ